MRICCLIPSLSLGGMERVMSALANFFADEKKAEVYILLFGRDRDVKYPISDKITILKPYFKFDNTKRKLCTIKTIFWIRKTVKSIKPNTLLSFGEFWNNLVLLSLFGTKYHVYLSDRSTPNKNLGALNNILRKILYPYAAGIICQTEKAFEIMNKRIKHKNITIIGNPIREIKRNKDEYRENIVLSVGRLIDTKHFDRLISVFAKVNNPDWKLVVVGGDSLKQNNLKKLKNKVRNLQMEDRIIFEGYKSNVEDYMLKSKLFAFTSSSEGFPNVIGEALSSGLPVVSYDCVAGPSDMIEDGKNGFLVPVFDDEMMAEKLSKLMSDEGLRNKMSFYASESIKQFSNNSICQKFYDYITLSSI